MESSHVDIQTNSKLASKQVPTSADLGSGLHGDSWLLVAANTRPELRFDHSWDARGYDNGTARNQLFFGMDLIYKF